MNPRGHVLLANVSVSPTPAVFYQLPFESQLTRISHQAASDTDKALVIKREIEMIKNPERHSRVPITVQAGLRVRKLALHSNRSYGYAFRSRAALSNTSPPVPPGGEMITQRFGSTKDFAKEWNNRVYFRLSKMLCGFNLESAVEYRISAVPQASGQDATCS